MIYNIMMVFYTKNAEVSFYPPQYIKSLVMTQGFFFESIWVLSFNS